MSKPLNRLFVYGTLAPGGSGHHLLESLPGTWQVGTITGKLYPDGFGLTAGYPVVDIREVRERVPGFLFRSDALEECWARLDAYEGEGYRRARVAVTLADGVQVETFVYVLDE